MQRRQHKYEMHYEQSFNQPFNFIKSLNALLNDVCREIKIYAKWSRILLIIILGSSLIYNLYQYYFMSLTRKYKHTTDNNTWTSQGTRLQLTCSSWLAKRKTHIIRKNEDKHLKIL